MSEVIAFILGMSAGASFGVFIVALCWVAKKGDGK